MATVTGYTSARMKQIEDKAIVSGTILGDNLILITYDGTEINAGNVRGPQGIDGPIGEVSLEDLNAAIAAAHATGAITSEQLATGAVTVNKIGAGAVTSSKLGASAVTESAVAANAIASSAIQAGAVATTHLAANAVTGSKIASGTITGDKIGLNTITEGNLQSLAVTSIKLAGGAVTTTKLGDSSVTEPKIANNSITEAKFANAQVLDIPWTNAGVLANWSTPLAPFRRLRYKRIGLNTVFLSGAIRKTGGGDGISTCASIASDHAPTEPIFGTVGALEPDGTVDATVKTFRINSDGNITIYGAIQGIQYGFCVAYQANVEG